MRFKQELLALWAGLCVVLTPAPALAYIGPGAGLGALAVTVALVIGVVLLAVGLIWYPLKRMLKRRKPVAGDMTRADH